MSPLPPFATAAPLALLAKAGSGAQAPVDAARALIWPDAMRQAAFTQWLAAQTATHSLVPQSVRPASADASFRRYFRLDTTVGGSCIIMDAPPALENCQPFVQVAALMQAAGLRVPQVLSWDEAKGFMLLSDLGPRTLLESIDPAQPQAAHAHYLQAVDALIAWQKASRPGVLPPYDAALLRRELELFPAWYLARHCQLTPDAPLLKPLDALFESLIAENLAAPHVYVHRDFMPRNLMLPEPGDAACGLGVLDFQDAVHGPITYDIASLLRDAFVSWEEDFVLDITVRYWQQARQAGLFQGHTFGDDFGAFYRSVEWMGLQRHLKVLGIFARLTLRDGKPKYLADAPRFSAYVRNTCARYRELTPLLRLLDQAEGRAAPVGYAFGKMS
ncbi:MAG: aminoglycoside phosphotransferase family protein [Burkholderiaceae bacterium]